MPKLMLSRLALAVAGVTVVGLALTPAGDSSGDWGTIKGKVIMSKPPEPRAANVTADREFCSKDGPVVYEDILVNKKNKGVQNVVVWLRPDSDNRRDPFPKDKIHPDLATHKPVNQVIDQPCCQFIPRVIAAREGDTLEVKNSAKVNHNINYTSDIETFNINIPPGKSHKAQQPLKAQNTPIPFKCDVHPWMGGRVRVFDHPYFAITDEDGNFEIKNAPAGNWRLVVWHENGFHKGREGLLGMPVTVKADGTEVPEIDLELP